jgi:O-antigen/teichoic acid export membrane protein
LSVAGRIARNTATTWLRSLIAALVALFLVRFLLTHLGQAGYGTVELITTIVYLTILTDLGLRAALSRHLAEQVALANPQRVNELFNSALSCYLVLGLTLAGLFALCAEPIVDYFEIAPEQRAAAISLVRWYVALSAIMSFVAPSFGALIEADHRFDITDLVQITDVLVRFVGVLALLGGMGLGLYGWAAAMLGARAVSVLTLMFFAKRLYPPLQLGARFVRIDAFRDLYSLGGFLFLHSLVLQVNTLTDPVVLARFLGPVSVAIYKPALLVVTSAYPFVAALSRQIKPLVTALQATGNDQQVQEVTIRGTRLTILIAVPFCVVFGAFAHPIISIWLGDTLGADALVTAQALTLLSLMDLATHIRETQSFVMVGLNRVRFMTLVQAAGGIASIVCGIALVWWLHRQGWGYMSVVGVAVPAVVSSWAQLAVITVHIGRETGIGVRRYLLYGFGRGLAVLLITVSVAVALAQWVAPKSLLTLIPCVAVTGCAWLIASWTIGFDRRDRVRVGQIAAGAVRRALGRAAATATPEADPSVSDSSDVETQTLDASITLEIESARRETDASAAPGAI